MPTPDAPAAPGNPAHPHADPFADARLGRGVLPCPIQGESIPMILRHEEVRKAARDWKTYSSDAPFRIPIPSEENVRSVRQLPVEVDPPDHTEYRDIVEPFFQRARDPQVMEQVRVLVEQHVREATRADALEVVRQMALPIQSHALAYLLNVPQGEATRWIQWGTHVFRDGGSGEKKGAALEAYLEEQFQKAAAAPGPDFFSALNQATFRDRPLNHAEKMGFANLTFAGGRDTVIHTLSSTLVYLARHPEALPFLREDPSRITLACEEFFRMVTPLTHIARVCPVPHDVLGETVPAGGRVSLCWASANRDGKAFPDPDVIRLDRKPNPHVAFGSGPHLCLGAGHARLLLRSLLQACVDWVDSLECLAAEPQVERESAYERVIGFERAVLRFTARLPS
jgi:cytochrome P450